jgi:hypothetical protein
MPKPKRDIFVDLEEWQEHQYNPYYWVNRISLGTFRRRSKGWFIVTLIEIGMILPAFILSVAAYFSGDHRNLVIAGMILFGLLSVVSILTAIRLKPKKYVMSQEERDEIRQKENEEIKKAHPKRRKDYK